MPVKISNQPSNPSAGIININEMNESLRKYKEEISITTLSGDYTGIKTLSCSFSKNGILMLLGIDPATVTANNIDGIKIQFGVHPSGHLSCDLKDYSYRINTLLFATDDNGNDLKGIDDNMLIPGFKISTPAAQDECCGSMSGGNATSS